MQVAELTIHPVGQLAGLGITHNMCMVCLILILLMLILQELLIQDD